MNNPPLKLSNVVGIVSKNSLEYVRAVFESYVAGAVVVLLRSDADCSRIKLFGIDRVVDPQASSGWMNAKFNFPKNNTIAQISFTSGTESEPKGVVLTHESLANVTTRLNSAMEVDETIKEYVGVPVNYSFGLGRCRAVAEVGGEFFLPENGFNPSEIKKMLLADEINAISAVPSLWRILLAGKTIFGAEVDKVRWIEIGSQFMSAEEKMELKKLFNNAIIVQHYGLTEASRTTLLRIDKASEKQMNSVGRAYGDTSIEISEDGRIRVAGSHVASKVIINGRSISNTDEHGWLQTNDLGRMEDDFLYYIGRADDLINCGGIKLSPDAIELNIQTRYHVKSGVAVARYSDLTYGDVVLVSYLKASFSDSLESFKNGVYDALANLGLSNKDAIRFFEADSFPVTDTGKVMRKDLSILYGKYCSEHPEALNILSLPSRVNESTTKLLTPRQAEISAIWSKVLNIQNIDIDSSFYDLGGNSLTALLAVMEMERNNISSAISKGMLQGLCIRQIASSMEESPDVSKIPRHEIVSPAVHTNMTVNVVRGFLALCVVFAHWSAGFFDRLPTSLSWIEALFSPLLAIGTPGFSIIYGVSAGYSLFPAYKTDPGRFRAIQKKTLLVLSAGIVLDGFVYFMNAIAKGDSISLTEFFNLFYSVLTYYWLITASIGLIFWGVKRTSQPISFVILLAIVAYYLDQIVFLPLASFSPQGVLEFLKLLFTAKYAYFNMLSGTAAGLAVGMWLGRKEEGSNPYAAMLPTGLACMLLGLLISYHAADLNNWLVWPVSTNKIWRWITYVGVIFLLLNISHKMLSSYEGYSDIQRYFLQILAVCGMLAFPIFVLHELVLPVRDILILSISMNSRVALLVGLVSCFAPFIIMYRKIYSASFS